MAQLSAWIRAKLAPGTLFGRLALLLFSAMLTGHILALGLMLHLWPDMFGTGSKSGLTSETGGSEMADVLFPALSSAGSLSPLASFSHFGFWLDLGIRLLALMLAAWIGARWFLSPVQCLAHTAHELEHNHQRSPRPGESARTYREISDVFKPMSTKLSHALSETDFFAAAVSHDLRAPLTRLALRVEGLSSEEQQRGFWRDIREMNAMISSTLNHLRGVADPEPFVSLDLVSLLNSVADDQLACGHVVHIFDADAHLPCAPLRTQASALRRCISNLVDNAVRYGGSAKIQYRDAADHVCIEISDHGPGIPDAELDKVLIPFYRVEGSRNRNSGGVGLGLSISNSIVRRLQGQLSLNNAPAGGLVVTVTLPR